MSREFATSLLGHQRAAVDKIGCLRVGLLFMEMGTGKTRAMLEIGFRKLWAGKASRIVWLTPISTKPELRREIRKHAPWASVCELGSGDFGATDVVIVGSESLSGSARMRSALEVAARGAFVVVDESDLFRNYYTRRTNAIRAVQRLAAYRFAMSGTPMGKGIEDLYPVVEWLDARIWGYNHFRQFSYYHLEWSEDTPRRIIRRRGQSVLTAKMAPYVYSVTKEECLDLPSKVYAERVFRMASQQEDEYAKFKRRVFDHYLDSPDDSMVYRLFSGLQRIVSGIRPKPIPDEDRSAGIEEAGEAEEDTDSCLFADPLENPRITTLRTAIREIAPNRKVIVWCKYTLDIRWCAEMLRREVGVEAVATHHGLLKESERVSELARFRDATRFLIATPGTGGRGLNLTEASYAIYYNNSFKFLERAQSEDRIHRIGQTLPCHYLDILCQGSIDTTIRNCLTKRENAFEAFKRETREIREMRNKRLARRRLETLIDNFDKEGDGSEKACRRTGSRAIGVAA